MTFVQFTAISVGGFVGGGFQGNHLDISPKYAALLWAISSSAGQLPGIFGGINDFLIDRPPFLFRQMFLSFLSLLDWADHQGVSDRGVEHRLPDDGDTKCLLGHDIRGIPSFLDRGEEM